jgi:hypothetical protein
LLKTLLGDGKHELCDLAQPGATLKVEDILDRLEKEGFVAKLYKP